LATPLAGSVPIAHVPGGGGGIGREGEGATLLECLTVGSGSCLHLIVAGGVVCHDGCEVDLGVGHGACVVDSGILQDGGLVGNPPRLGQTATQ